MLSIETYQVFGITLAIAIPLLLLGLYFLGKSIYSASTRGVEKYSLLNCFPFEMYKAKSDGSKGLAIFTGFYLAISAVASYLMIDQYILNMGNNFFLSLLVAILHIASLAILLCLLLVPAFYHKQHLLLVSIHFALLAGYAFTAGLLLLNTNVGNSVGVLVMAILLFVISAARLLSMLLPQFSDWAKYPHQENEEGEVVSAKPKFFLLAFSEWLNIIFEALSTSILLIGLVLRIYSLS